MTNMIQIVPDMPASLRWFKDQNVITHNASDDLGYAWHAILTAAFGEQSPDVFRTVEQPGRALRLLGYSDRNANDLKEYASSFADPLVYSALNVDEIASKPMPSEFRQGQRFGFEVRLRPTTRKTINDKVIEKDAFLRALDREPERQDIDRSVVYRDWVVKRMREAGASLDLCAIDSFKMSKSIRRNRSGKGDYTTTIEGPDVVFSGILSILDPTPFMDALSKGLGRHKAFGFGMILLAPPK